MDTILDYDSCGLAYEPYKAPKYVILSAHEGDVIGMQVFLKKLFPSRFEEIKFKPLRLIAFIMNCIGKTKPKGMTILIMAWTFCIMMRH
jgi:hypothetical protein